MAVQFGVVSGGAWGIFQSAEVARKADVKEVIDEDGYAVEQKAVSIEETRTFDAMLVVNATPPDAGEVLTLADTWTGLVTEATLSSDNGTHWKKYKITASRKDSANLTAYAAPSA